MSDADLAHAERGGLCDLLLEVGPDQPTLCEGWTTADLAAHLVMRERKPLAAGGIVIGPLRGYAESVRLKVRDGKPYEDLVEVLRSGPPALLRPMDGAINLSEYFIHHEDVRRAAGDTTPRPVEAVADVEERLWAMQGRRTKLMIRKLDDVDITLASPDGDTKPIGGGSRPVTIAGRPGEVVLFLSGRREAAHVELSGDADAIEAVRTGPLGI